MPPLRIGAGRYQHNRRRNAAILILVAQFLDPGSNGSSIGWVEPGTAFPGLREAVIFGGEIAFGGNHGFGFCIAARVAVDCAERDNSMVDDLLRGLPVVARR